MRLCPHQKTAVEFLTLRGFACLWDEPGLGKTPSAVVAAASIQPRRVLVTCPAAVRQHWAREFTRWAGHLPVQVETGYPACIGDGVTIVSHACFANSQAYGVIRRGGPYDLLIVDEADAMRSYTAARTRNLFPPPPDSIWAFTRRLWCLTGTPVVNSASDLYPLFAVPLGMYDRLSWFDFCSQFSTMQPDSSQGVKSVGLKNAYVLAQWLRPHVLRRTGVSIGLDLPPLTIDTVFLRLPAGEMARAMAGLENWTPDRLAKALEMQDEVRDADISRARHALGLAKIQAVVADLTDMLSDGHGPLVCFFQHTSVRDGIRQLMAKNPHIRVGVIDGKTTRKNIGAAEAALQAKQLHLLLVQTQAGGVGLTLTASHEVQVIELPWTSTALYQAIARVHRMTQINPCRAKIYQLAGCWLEDVLRNAVSRKQKASADLLGLLTTST
jgi:SWI/SNF-related matrix-associated actin-dependent regulator 1 of chromatin subfamily A